MIELEKMSKLDFEDYIKSSIKRYAKEKVKAGTWSEEEALKKSEEETNKLINGLDSKKQYLFKLIDKELGIKVGYMWFQVFEKLIGKEAFIFDFIIFKEFRGKGYETQTMKSLNRKAKELNIDKISLHVFGHNHIAIKLYKKMGYEITDINMSKQVF